MSNILTQFLSTAYQKTNKQKQMKNYRKKKG